MFGIFSSKFELFQFSISVDRKKAFDFFTTGFDRLQWEEAADYQLTCRDDIYIRFWGYYTSKILYNLGYPENPMARKAIELLERIVEQGIEPYAYDFLEESEILGPYTYGSFLDETTPVASGRFFRIGSEERYALETKFPFAINELEIALSPIVVLQFLRECYQNEKESFQLLKKTVEHFVKIYRTNGIKGVEATVQVPEESLRLAEKDMETV